MKVAELLKTLGDLERAHPDMELEVTVNGEPASLRSDMELQPGCAVLKVQVDPKPPNVEPGFYWWKEGEFAEPEPVEVKLNSGDALVIRVIGEECEFEITGGTLLQRIEPPDELSRD